MREGKQLPQINQVMRKLERAGSDVICLQEALHGDGFHFYEWGGFKGEPGTPIVTQAEFPGALQKEHTAVTWPHILL